MSYVLLYVLLSVVCAIHGNSGKEHNRESIVSWSVPHTTLLTHSDPTSHVLEYVLGILWKRDLWVVEIVCGRMELTLYP